MVVVTIVFMVFIKEANTEPQRWRGKQFWPRNTYYRGANGPLQWWSGGGHWSYRGASRPLEWVMDGDELYPNRNRRPPHPGWGAPPTPKPKPKHPGWMTS